MVLRPNDEYGGYAMDNYPQTGGGAHHFYESIKTELESFRLRGADGDFSASVAAASEALLSDDTSSIASKKRIDSMFKTTASVTGDTKRTTRYRAGRLTKSLADDNNHYGGAGGGYFDYGYAADTGDRNNNNNNNKNTVQEKIEKMFAEISSSELDTDVSMDSAAPATDTGSNKFHVQYIGCAGLSGKISSLEGLQKPVRDMYFGYRENQHHYRGGDNLYRRGYYHHNDDDNDRTATRRDFSGLLEISAGGLTIRYRNELGDLEQRTNAFPTIAVWAALKYVCRRRSPTPQRRIAGEGAAGAGYEYAFLPLIADPDGSDKAPLFRDMDPGDRARLDAAGDHAPVFAVVTRAAGKRLECHGFACETENDALLMAANLYGALVAAMSSAAVAVDADAPTTGDGAGRLAATSTRRVIRQRNGFTSMSSTAGSSVAGGGGAAEEAPALPPPRPPRRNKKSSTSSITSATSDGGGVSSAMTSVPADGNHGNGEVCSGAKTFQLTVRQAPSLQRGVCNSSSVAGSAAEVQPRSTRQQRPEGGGDILTKVAIPRSRSFLNSNGLASTKYSRRAAGCGIETAAADRRRRRSNGSGIMGFSEMFNELRAQEGLNNMDDILNAIINVEGMSYNDLKPIYKEFLMKLALTLTKDELYQRTKAIMTEQKRKRNKRRPAVATQAAGRGRRLNDKLRDALNLRAAKSRISAVLMPNFCKRKTRNRGSRKQKQQLLQQNQQQQQQQRRHRCSCLAVAGSSAEVRPAVDRKPERKFQRRAIAGKRPAGKSASKGRTASGTSTSDDSDFFAAAALRQRQRQHQQLQQQLLQQPSQLYKKTSKKRGSGGDGGGGRGTATASEGGCLHRASSGYFSCSECSAGDAADDDGCCYCGDGAADPTTSLVSCSCDSDSCADSDKCYCGKPRRPRNIFDELKSRGFAASESSVSRADSPGTAWKKNELLMLLQQRHDDSSAGMAGDESSPAASGGGRCGIEPSKSIEYLQMTRRACPGNNAGVDTTAAIGSSSSPSSSLSAATVYSSSSAVHQRRPQPPRGAKHHHRRSGSSGSDNFRAIDYALFAATAADASAGPRKSRGCGGRQNHRRPDCAPVADGRRRAAASSGVGRRSYSSEAVHMAGCRVQYGGHARQPLLQQTKPAARRHSVHDGDVLSSFFKCGIENSLGYYP
ncbi:uncharacterized protein LOC132921583 [Rhopalosiphum padi]|uniref:uncharacterized protein LOC132921583 n=1 Tax=Rhopalosiphum padi TaxID=40932 RepID=UPI00298DE6A5|nr:uncharacterized protein LOC132921583 [Rhopalosiphum padi]